MTVMGQERDEGAPSARSEAVMASLQELGRAIRARREERGMTQEELARACGISVSFASLLERGERSPSYDTLVQVAAVLGVPPALLLSGGVRVGEEDPGYERLAEFARARRLSRSQVERLLAVGEVMFAETEAVDASAPQAATCREPGCERAVLARGLCAAHYHRARRAGR